MDIASILENDTYRKMLRVILFGIIILISFYLFGIEDKMMPLFISIAAFVIIDMYYPRIEIHKK